MARFEQFSPGEAPALVLQLNDAGEPITVPNAHLLFTAQFEHQGSDLVLTGDDGQTVVVEDYFTAETLPDLISPEGGRLYASVVESLAGPRAPGQYAQAGSPDGRQPIGQVETLEGSATAQRTDGTVVELQVGTPVFQGDVVATGSGSKVAITFIDKTVFSLSEEARMVLDELVYSPGGDDNSMLINLVQGTFVFVAGEVAPSGDMKVQTPVATLGIRGTTVIATILADGTMKASLVADPPGPDGTPGEVGSYGIFLPDASGNLVLAATVTTTGDNYVVTPTSVTGVPTVVATVPKTTSDLASDTDAIATVYQAFSAAQQRLEQIEQESTEEETDENTDDPDQQNDGDDTTGENDTTPGSGLQDSGIEDAGSDSGPAGDLGGDSESDGDSTPGFTLFETDGSTDGEGEPVLVETTPDFEPIIPDVVVDTPPVVVAPVVTNVTQNAPNVSTVNLLPEGAIVDADDDQLNVVDGSLQQTDGPALDTPPVVNNNFLEFDPSEFSDLGIDESVDLEFEFDVEDEDGEVVTQTLTLTVDGVNDAPTEDVEVPDQFLVQGGQVTVNVPLDAFDDLDTNDTLTLSATLENGDPLPAWLQFNVVAGGPGVPDTGQFIIDGTEDNRGGHRIILIGTDGEGEVATQEIEIKIDPVSTGDVQVGERSVFVDVDPRATYLRTSNDPDTVLNPLDVPNLLAEQAYSFDDPDLPPGVTLMPGMILGLQGTGDFTGRDNILTDNDAPGFIVVFSASDLLLEDTSLLNRLPNAVQAIDGVSGDPLDDAPTEPTREAPNDPTDIPEDFSVNDQGQFQSTLVEIPAGATHAFATLNDTFFSNNADPEEDLGVNIYIPMVVGIDGTGTLTITGGEDYRDSVYLGLRETADGTLTIEGGATFEVGGEDSPDTPAFARPVDGELIVGHQGTGTLNIIEASEVLVTSNGVDDPASSFIGGYRNVRIAQGEGSYGTVNVTGPGSKLITEGESNRVTVGRKGTGELNVTGGAEVRTTSLDVGREGTATGTVNIDGAGSQVIIRTALPDSFYGDTSPAPEADFPYSGFAGLARAGRLDGSKGYFYVTNGGLLHMMNYDGYTDDPTFSLGRDDGSFGKAVIEGAGSELRINQYGPNGDNYNSFSQVQVGQRGHGILEVKDSAQVNLLGDRAGAVVGNGFDALAEDPTSQLMIESGGSLTINSGPAGYGARLIVGANSSEVEVDVEGLPVIQTFRSNGLVEVTDVGSKIDIISNNPSQFDGARAIIGRYGNGQLRIYEGAQVNITAQGTGQPEFIVGNGGGSTGFVKVSGYGSYGDYGDPPNDPSTLKVSTTNNIATNTPNIIVGNHVDATADLEISNGGKVEIEGQNATLFVSSLFNGSGYTQALLSSFTVEEGGYLHVNSGDAATEGGFIEIGSTHANSNGALNISGGGYESYIADTLVKTTGAGNFVNVGDLGTGALTMQGGILETDLLQVGHSAGGSGTVNINGFAAQVNLNGVGGNLDVGFQGTGDVTISGGADVTAESSTSYQAVRIGGGDGGDGTVTVTGTGSTLTAGDGAPGVTGAIRVGQQGTGVLEVLNGADVFGFFLDVGRGSPTDGDADGEGTVRIDGVGSRVLLSSAYGEFPSYAGEGAFSRFGREDGGVGNLFVTNGGLFQLENIDGQTDWNGLRFGRNDGAKGYGTVSGSGSRIFLNQIGFNGDDYAANSVLNVGENGYGKLTVEMGGQVDIMGDRASLRVANSHSLGSNPDAEESASLLEVKSGGTITIDSRGTDTVYGYGQVGYGARLAVATQAVDEGEVLVDGAGSLIEIITDNPEFNENPGIAGTPTAIPSYRGASATIGQYGKGTLTIQDGGAVTLEALGSGHPSFAIASGEGSYGDVVVTGAGSRLEVTDDDTSPGYATNINIGNDYNATGALTISDGATVLVQGLNASLFISSLFNNDNAGITQSTTLSEVTVDSGGTLNVFAEVGGTNGSVGGFISVSAHNAFGNASLIVDGAGSSVNAGGAGNQVNVGTLGTGNLEVRNSGTLTADIVNVGNNTGDGTGTVSVTNGGTINADITLNGGANLSGDGTVNGNVVVFGTDASLAPGTSPGVLTITNGNLTVVDGLLDYEIDGVDSSPTQQFDKIDVTSGSAFLQGGTLRLTFGSPAAFTAFTGTPLSLLQTSIAVTLTASAFALELIGADADFGVVVRESGTNLVAAALVDEGAPTNTLQHLTDAGADGDLTATITDGSGSISGSYGGSAIFGNVETLVGGDYFNDFTAYGTADVRFTGGDGGNAFTGAAGADTLEGGSGGDTLIGNDGNDLIIGGGGPDVLEGGAGDDILQISDTGFSSVDGGADQDTLVLYGYVDLAIAYGQLGTGPGQKDISNIERIDLSGGLYGYGSVTIDYDAVVALSPDINDLLEAALPVPLQGTGETLVIDGDGSVEGGDTVFLVPAGGTWADSTFDAFGTHSVFSYTGVGGGAVLALVAIDDDVTVFTSSY